MKYKISDFSKISGVCPANLRYFEQTGLIAPERDASGYRLYSINDAYRINTFNSLTAQGFTLTDAASKTEKVVVEDYLARLHGNIQKMQNEKVLLEKRIEWAKMLEKVYSDPVRYRMHPLVRHIPACSFLPCVLDGDLSPSLTIGETISRLVDILPFSAYAGMSSKDGELLGMLCADDILASYGIDTSEMVSVPEGDYAVILVDDMASYEKLIALPEILPFFPDSSPTAVYSVYLMVETEETVSRAFLLYKL